MLVSLAASSSRWFSVNQQVVPVNCADSRTLDVSKGLLEEVQHEDICEDTSLLQLQICQGFVSNLFCFF